MTDHDKADTADTDGIQVANLMLTAPSNTDNAIVFVYAVMGKDQLVAHSMKITINNFVEKKVKI